MKKVALGVGYCFNLFEENHLNKIKTKPSGEVVVVEGVKYAILKGETYEDSRMIDYLLDQKGDLRISDYFKRP